MRAVYQGKSLLFVAATAAAKQGVRFPPGCDQGFPPVGVAALLPCTCPNPSRGNRGGHGVQVARLSCLFLISGAHTQHWLGGCSLAGKVPPGRWMQESSRVLSPSVHCRVQEVERAKVEAGGIGPPSPAAVRMDLSCRLPRWRLAQLSGAGAFPLTVIGRKARAAQRDQFGGQAAPSGPDLL